MSEEALRSRLELELCELPAHLMKLAAAFGVLSVAGLFAICFCATYFAIDLGVHSAMVGSSTTGAFSLPTFLAVAGMLVVFIFVGSIVDEQLYANREGREKELADPVVFLIRLLFVVPHMFLLNWHLLKDALQLRRSSYDLKLGVHLMKEARDGVFLEHADHAEAPDVFRSTLVALERGHLIERHVDNDERLRLTVEGHELMREVGLLA